MTNYQRTAAWLKSCGKEPGTDSASLQVGIVLEEFAELTACLRVSQDGWQIVLERLTTDLNSLANALKQNKIVAHIPNHLRVDALDAICDSCVTLDGLAYFSGFDKDAADQEVLRSNESKLENGKPVILPGGKIGKGKDYSPPNLTTFI